MSATAQPAGAEAPATGTAAEDAAQPRYVGLTTRTIAFVVDAALINLVAIVVEVGVAVTLSVLHLHRLRTLALAIGAGVYTIWTIAYFVAFWSTGGQTPGGRMMRFRVVKTGGGRTGFWRALVRYFGFWLSAMLLFTGFAMIPLNRRRRGLLDFIAGTVVVDAPQLSIAEKRRRQRHASDATR